MDYKELNKQLYDTYAREFEERTRGRLTNQLLKDIDFFINRLPGKAILDLGSGPGRDSLFFKRKGLKPLCFDISQEMIDLCKQKGLEAQIGDLEDIPFSDSSFDGIWAATSLLHMPKSNFPAVLNKISRILKPIGQFYLSMKEGNFEGLVESDKYPGMKRFFALYSNKELGIMLLDNFEIKYATTEKIGDATFLNYLCENRE